MSAVWLGFNGSLSVDTLRLFLLGLPMLLLGTWLGLRLYGRLDETRFRNLVLMLLLASGVSLV
jgi:uncharacterized membrane protein YfcA